MLWEHNQGAYELAQYSTNCTSMGGGGVTDMWRGWSYCSSAKLKRTVNFLFFTIKVLEKWHQLLLLRITNGIFTKMYCKSLKQAFQEEPYWLLFWLWRDLPTETPPPWERPPRQIPPGRNMEPGSQTGSDLTPLWTNKHLWKYYLASNFVCGR